ncbi:MAG TPA: tail fiber domain-containing protein [Polyangiaceae bacterium]|nr:tail fiber domain-containing protein [Polyangiaceae bacterium]
MTKQILFLASLTLGLALSVSPARAQEFRVQGSNTSSTDIFDSNNTATNAQDRIAVHGLSLPQAYWGIGARFEGGYRGVDGYATMSGAGARYGGYFQAAGGSTANYAVYAYAPTGASNYAGYFSGNVYVSGTLTQASDFKLKTQLQDMPAGTLSQVLKLRPKTFRYLSSSFPALSLPEGDQVGFIAQDVAVLFPQLVKEISVPSTDKTKPDEKFLSMDYVKVVPLLVKAIQEQQAQIDALKAQLDALTKH